jgi:hypothetical protein
MRWLIVLVACAGCGFDYDALRNARDAAAAIDEDAASEPGADRGQLGDTSGAVDVGGAASSSDAPMSATSDASLADAGSPDLPASSPDLPGAPAADAPTDLPADTATPPTREQVMYGCVADPELRACYTFDDPGTTLVDRSANENHGELNTAAVVAGAHGNALQFTDGKQYAIVRDRPSLRLSGSEATFEAWIRPDRAPVADMAADMWAAKVGLQNAGYSFAGYGGEIRVYAGAVARGGGTLTPGIWAHAAVVCSATGVTIYLDGVRAHPDPLPPVTFTPGPDLLTIGNLNPERATISAPYFAFYGAIDVLRIYGRARSPQEICADAGGTWSGNTCQRR